MSEGVEKGLATSLETIPPRFARLVRRLPVIENPPLPPEWLRLETVERYKVLSHAGIRKGTDLLEVGTGPHAIATVVLAHLVGPKGRVTTAEPERWTHVEDVLRVASLRGRVRPVACDARRLPFSSNAFDLAVTVHSVRSFRNEETIVGILRDMLRVSPRLVLAESLPSARTRAQEAHLEMYNLREEIFEALTGRKDDIHYLPLEKLEALVEEAGGEVVESTVLDIDQPHFLAFIPREYVEGVKDAGRREDLLLRWERAEEGLTKYGEEHPPVGVIRARREDSQYARGQSLEA